MNTSDESLPEKDEQAFKRSLVQLKVDEVNWKVLWKNQHTNQFWKEYFPHPEMHGGGPPAFAKLTELEAKAEFGSW